MISIKYETVWDRESGGHFGRETIFSPLLEIDMGRRRRQQQLQQKQETRE